MGSSHAVGFALALLALTPATALGAGSVSSDSSGTLTYTGDAGVNVVTITGTEGSPGTVTFAEPGITEGTDTANACTATTDLVSCSNPASRAVTANGDDGADRITVNGNSFSSLNGGPANDRLIGGESSDTLDGGGGADEILGRDGGDFSATDADGGDLIDLGPGFDSFRVANGDGGGDTLRGGTGADTLSYNWMGSPTSFRIDLSAGSLTHNASPPEAGDSLDSIENVHAAEFLSSTANDTLIGSNGTNTLAAGLGDDTVTGGPGTDQLLPDQGLGIFGLTEVGAGADTVLARDGFEDGIDCGGGSDTAVIDQFDAPLLGGTCENVQQADVSQFGIAPAAAPDRAAPTCRRSKLARQKRRRFLRTGVRVTYTCNEEAQLDVTALVRVRRTPGGRIRLARAGDLVLAERRLRFGTGARSVRLRVAKNLRRALGKRFKVTLRAVAVDRSGNRRTTASGFRVR
jgi:Ca2+-binding RTX toxin-like protein